MNIKRDFTGLSLDEYALSMRGDAWTPADFGWTPYRAVWIHEGAHQILSYCEGDVTIETHDNPSDFAAAIERARKFYETH